MIIKIIIGIWAIITIVGLCCFFYSIYKAPLVPPEVDNF